jgi:hypothetical protein
LWLVVSSQIKTIWAERVRLDVLGGEPGAEAEKHGAGGGVEAAADPTRGGDLDPNDIRGGLTG